MAHSTRQMAGVARAHISLTLRDDGRHGRMFVGKPIRGTVEVVHLFRGIALATARHLYQSIGIFSRRLHLIRHRESPAGPVSRGLLLRECSIQAARGSSWQARRKTEPSFSPPETNSVSSCNWTRPPESVDSGSRAAIFGFNSFPRKDTRAALWRQIKAEAEQHKALHHA